MAAAAPLPPAFSSPLFHQPDIVPVGNLFAHGYWRSAALARIWLFFILRANIYYYIYKLIQGLLWLAIRAIRLFGVRNLAPDGIPSVKDIAFHISIKVLRRWPNTLVTSIWWQWYQLLADEGDFEMDYIAAWRHKLAQSNPAGPAPPDLHLWVDKAHLKAPIPTGPDDAATLRTLQMWYCLIQSRLGLSEILLPKRLTRIDRVHICRVQRRIAGLGDRIEYLVLGRSRSSHVAFFEDPHRVRDQVTVTQTLLANPEEEGLEFVRSWNIVAISAIVLLPFVLSLVFGGVWVGVFVKRGTDVQVAVQTAYTVASYIVTAGALLVALIAFVDNQTPKNM